MATYPTYTTQEQERNSNRPHISVTVTPQADGSDPQQNMVNQQWRDVKVLGLDKEHAYSLNRDASEVS